MKRWIFWVLGSELAPASSRGENIAPIAFPLNVPFQAMKGAGPWASPAPAGRRGVAPYWILGKLRDSPDSKQATYASFQRTVRNQINHIGRPWIGIGSFTYHRFLHKYSAVNSICSFLLKALLLHVILVV